MLRLTGRDHWNDWPESYGILGRILWNTQKEQQLSVGFFGGEPLLVYDLMLRLMQYAVKETKKAGKNISFSMTTNGLLFNEERLSTLENFPLRFALSLDGEKAVHDRFRVKPDGTGSFDELYAKIPLILQKAPQTSVRMTANPETAACLSNSVEFLIGSGFKDMAIGLNSYAKWTLDDLRSLDQQLRLVARRYVELILADTPIRISAFHNSLQNLISETRPHAMCDAGRSFVNIDCRGNIFPCHHFACMNDFAGSFPLGNLDHGVDRIAQLPFIRLNAEKSLGCLTPCNKCRALPICGGGCPAKAYEKTGFLQMSDPIEQKFMLILYDVIRDIYKTLKKYQPPLFRHWCTVAGKKTSKGKRKNVTVFHRCSEDIQGE